MITQNDFLIGEKFTFGGSRLVFRLHYKKSKKFLRSGELVYPVLDMDSEGFCYTKENWENHRVDFKHCKLIDNEE